MHLVSLAITDFRNIVQADIQPDATGTTVITGVNGAGKTSILEAVGRPFVTYGFGPEADIRAVDIVRDGVRSRYQALRQGRQRTPHRERHRPYGLPVSRSPTASPAFSAT